MHIGLPEEQRLLILHLMIYLGFPKSVVILMLHAQFSWCQFGRDRTYFWKSQTAYQEFRDYMFAETDAALLATLGI
jgi:hypothetical protein